MPRSAQAIVTAIVLKRTQRKGAVVVLEGADDARLMRPHVDEALCSFEIAEGKQVLLEAVRLSENEGIKGVLGVADPNSWRALGIPEGLSANVILVDCMDGESMLIRSPALDRVVAEFGSHEKIGGVDVRVQLYELVRPLAVLRLLNARDELALRFDGLSLADIVDPREWKFDLDGAVELLRQRSRRQDLDHANLVTQVNQFDYSVLDAGMISHGKDLVQALSIGLRRRWGTRPASEVTPENLSRALRLAFSREMFVRTRLYDQIVSWQERNGPYTILPARYVRPGSE